ncbi:MAG: tyrosine-protein phosphatase, partial [Clostridia bacterium]|nr:tyrosine-protein phosphatase [Clostridia bacterium]
LNNGDRVYSSIFDFTTDETVRTVTIDGVSNTRDIGGYETAYGYVQQGLVYRSARLESITEDGKATLKDELGLKTDLDLRGQAESTTGANSQNPAGLDNYYTFDTPQYAYAANLGLDYKDNFTNVGSIMKVFANKENYPIDVHCAVGRDRTGTMIALLKAVLGYNETEILKDYFTSMFATTGAWSKETTGTNKGMISNVLSYLNSFEGATLADRAANYLTTNCGITQAEIDTIRNIMTGKEAVEIPAYNTFEDTDNYAEYSFVTFEKFGTAKVLTLVGANETVAAPFEAGEGYVWTVNGQAYDFTATVTADMTIKASKANAYTVNVLSTGAVNAQESVTVNEGGAFDFSTLAKAGYDFVVISSEGKVITELTVAENTTINVIYINK